MKCYTLAKEVNPKELKSSHKRAVVQALQKLGSGSVAEIAAKVRIKTKMEARPLVAWVICQKLIPEGLVKELPAKSRQARKATA